jgi:hypothetical protein
MWPWHKPAADPAPGSSLAKRQGPDGLQLCTDASNIMVQGLDERHGFVAEEHLDGSGNEERAPILRYALRTPAIG